MENHVEQVTAQQRALGHHVTVLFNVGQATAEHDIQVLPGRHLTHWRPQAFRDVVFCLAALHRLRRNHAQFDAVHIHGDWCSFLLVPIIARAVGARLLVASIHDQTRQRPGFAQIYRAALAPYDMCYSTGMADAQRLTAFTDRRVEWITSGVSEDWFIEGDVHRAGRTGKEFDVLSVGTLIPRKNVGLTLEIARRLPQYSFGIVGDGPSRAVLERAAADLPNVRFLGRLGRVELRRAYMGSRVFLGTAISEGTPTVMLEAMALGLAVVTSRSNDYSAVLPDDRHGRVVDGSDPSLFAEAVVSYLENDHATDVASRVNPTMARSFTWPTIARRIDGLMLAIDRLCKPAAHANGEQA